MLLSIDVVAGVNTIFATPLRATQETAEPISRSLNVPINIVDPKGVEELIEEIMDNHKGKIILIVTHPEVLPQLIAGFQGSKKIESASLQDLDQLFVVTVPWFGKVKTLQLRYGS
jgi:broad specificity phosphatase PhoE